MPRKNRSPEIITTTPEQRPVIGYVVRYERSSDDGSPSEPLWLDKKPYSEFIEEGILIRHTHQKGTLFLDIETAYEAVQRSIAFQRKNQCHWNEIYGAYLIEPVAA